MRLDPGEMRVGDKHLCLHTLSDLDDLPQSVETDARYERLSTDRSDCRHSFAAPVGLLLGYNHIYNQFWTMRMRPSVVSNGQPAT